MSALSNTKRYTVDEYFALDSGSEIRYEYVYGYPVAMGGASPDHELIVANIMREAGNKLREKRDCRVRGSNLRTQIKENGRYAYPGASIVCGESQIGRGQTLLNPTVVFEILSPSTQNYDLGDKGADYRSIVSLQDIVYIHQDKPLITHVFRQGDHWVLKDYRHLTDSVNLQSIECVLSLSEIYDKVDFPLSNDETSAKGDI